MDTRLEPLFTPWKIGNCEIKNRIVLTSMNFPAAPFLLGVILGPMLDSNLRRALRLSDGSFLPMFQRPICIFFLAFIILLILAQLGVFKVLKGKKLAD